MELTTALIWTLRIVLPIILFCVYIKFQTSKDDQVLSKPTSTKNRYNRSTILSHRKAAAGKPKHEDLSNLVLKDQSEAPELFQSPEGGRRPGGRGAGRSGGGGQRGEEKRDRPKREPREPREPKDHGDRGERESRRSGRQPSELEKRLFEEAPAETPAAEGAAQLNENQEKMHLESLLNYVAFNRKEPQRNFMLDEDSAPPPPPPNKPAVLDSTAGEGEQSVKDLGKMTTEKANEEAQMVLRGAMNFKRVDVAKDLYAQLAAQNVDISESTYELMIEASILAQDITSSTDFLMKMESSGHSPCSELLDKVLDLYSSEKSQREQRKKKAAEAQGAELGDAQEARAKLKSDAPIFVPSFGIPPPPPKPKEAADGAGPGGTEGGTPTAAAPTEAAEQTPSAEATNQPEPRTKLKSAAQAFVPQFSNFEMEPTYDLNADTSNWGMSMLPSEVDQAIMQGLHDRAYAEQDYIFPGEDYGEYRWKGDQNWKGRKGDDMSNSKDKNGGGKSPAKGRGKQAKNGKGKSGDADTPAKTEEVKKTWKPKEPVSAS